MVELYATFEKNNIFKFQLQVKCRLQNITALYIYTEVKFQLQVKCRLQNIIALYIYTEVKFS